MSEEKTYSQMRKEFYNSFETKIVPKIKPFEAERKKTRALASMVSVGLVLIGIILLLAPLFEPFTSNDNNSNLPTLCLLLAWLSWYFFKKKFENQIKKQIMPIVCACFGNLKWSEGSYPGGHVFKDSYVIPTYNSVSYDDIFQGVYKDVHLDIVEGHFTYRSGRNQSTVFQGILVKLDMNKKFNSHTIIKPDSMLHISPSRSLKHTVLEDVKFEKNYDVFTNDPVDARYLITPSFMVRLNNMKTAFGVNKVSCAFHDNKLIIALQTNKDVFSLCSLVKPIDDSKQYYIMYEEIVSILKLIDYFKLNQNIGL